MSLRWRLALVVVLAASAGLAFLVWRTVAQLRPRYQEAMEEAMVDTATILAARVSTDAVDGRIDVARLATAMAAARERPLDARIYDVAKRRLAMDVIVTDERGIVVYDSTDPAAAGRDDSRWNDVARTLRGRYGARATRTVADDPATAVLHVAAPVLAGERVIGVLSAVKPVDAVTLFLATARNDLALSYALVAALLVTVAALATAWITAPIRRLTRHVEAVKAGAREALPALGGGEIAALGAAFADLRAELDGRAYIERYVQTLTHEMKSPLSAVRAAAELLAEEPPADARARFVANIAQEARRLQDLIERLLQLAALERRTRAPASEDCAAEALVADVAASLAPLAAERGIELATAAAPDLVVRGERFLVRQALANLVHNAIEFSPRGGRIEVTAAAVDGMAELRVADRGPGVPDYARERVFERFFSLPRPDTGRKGTGLGLTFAREVAAAHNGTIAVGPRPGGGTLATLRLPGVLTVATP